MAVGLGYQSEFYSEATNAGATEPDGRWRISILREGGALTPTVIFNTTKEGFVLNMGGRDDDMLAPIKTTTLTFNYILQQGAPSTILTDLQNLAVLNEITLWVLVERYKNSAWRRYWIGNILPDLSYVKIQALIKLYRLRL